jgi:hypothetical protein
VSTCPPSGRWCFRSIGSSRCRAGTPTLRLRRPQRTATRPASLVRLGYGPARSRGGTSGAREGLDDPFLDFGARGPKSEDAFDVGRVRAPAAATSRTRPSSGSGRCAMRPLGSMASFPAGRIGVIGTWRTGCMLSAALSRRLALVITIPPRAKAAPAYGELELLPCMEGSTRCS